MRNPAKRCECLDGGEYTDAWLARPVEEFRRLPLRCVDRVESRRCHHYAGPLGHRVSPSDSLLADRQRFCVHGRVILPWRTTSPTSVRSPRCVAKAASSPNDEMAALAQDSYGTDISECISEGTDRAFSQYTSNLASENGVRANPTIYVDDQEVPEFMNAGDVILEGRAGIPGGDRRRGYPGGRRGSAGRRIGRRAHRRRILSWSPPPVRR